MTVDEILTHIRAQLDLEAETEHEILEEIRDFLCPLYFALVIRPSHAPAQRQGPSNGR